jgi:hypothetical protein
MGLAALGRCHPNRHDPPPTGESRRISPPSVSCHDKSGRVGDMRSNSKSTGELSPAQRLQKALATSSIPAVSPRKLPSDPLTPSPAHPPSYRINTPPSPLRSTLAHHFVPHAIHTRRLALSTHHVESNSVRSRVESPRDYRREPSRYVLSSPSWQKKTKQKNETKHEY